MNFTTQVKEKITRVIVKNVLILTKHQLAKKKEKHIEKNIYQLPRIKF